MSRDDSPPDVGRLRAGRQTSGQRRGQLLACAMKVFAEHGLEAGNHSLVAAEAGVSVPLCFFYFKSRDELVDAVLAEVEMLFKGAFALAERDDLSALQALERIAAALIPTPDKPRYGTRVFIDWSIAVRSALWTRFLRLHRYLVGVLIRVIAQGQKQGYFRADLNPEDEAELLHASSFALEQLRMTGASRRRIARFQQSRMKRLLAVPVSKPPVSLARRRATGTRSGVLRDH